MEIIDKLARYFGVPDYIIWFAAGALGMWILQRVFRSSPQNSEVQRGTAKLSPRPGFVTKTEVRVSTPISTSLSINGQQLDIAPEKMALIQKLLHENKTIDAIKEIREASGLSLTEAKQLADTLAKAYGRI